MLEKPKKELNNKNRDLKVKDFFKNMKQRGQQLSKQELRLQFKKLSKRPWRNKWHLL
jgi:hypothetical protein